MEMIRNGASAITASRIERGITLIDTAPVYGFGVQMRAPGPSYGLRELTRPLDGTRFNDIVDRGPARSVRELSRGDRAALEGHFLALDADDRRLRFGIPMGDAAVRSYVERVDCERSALFGIFDDDLRLVGAAHLAWADSHAELGVSVLPSHRNRGCGGALLARACLRARNWGVRALFMQCLRENEAIMHLARKQGMEIGIEAAEADAWLKLAPADAASLFGDVFAQGVPQFDFVRCGRPAYSCKPYATDDDHVDNR